MKYKIGDLCEALKQGEVAAIGHQCNCFNTMGTGVAKAIKKHFPEAYEMDCMTTKGDKLKLGEISLAKTPYGYVYNLYGQYGYGRNQCHTDYTALESALTEMRDECLRDMFPAKKIGLPKLGSGHGGGDWSKVQQIIQRVFSGSGIDVTIYVLEEADVQECNYCSGKLCNATLSRKEVASLG